MGKKIIYNTESGAEYELAFGTVHIVIAPDMIGSLKEALKKAAEWQEKFKKVTPEELGSAENEMRNLFNEAFGTDICTPAFGDMSIFAITNSGKLLFTEFFDVFLPELEKDLRALGMTAKVNKPSVSPKTKKYLSDIPAVKPVAGLSKPYGDALPDISNLSSEQRKLLAIQLLS